MGKTSNFKFQTSNKGQVALIVLLISAVAMTMGLSLARKTVIDTRVETDQQQLKQAFNAAESGVEYYLGTGSTKYTSVDNVSQADIEVKNIGSGTTINYNQYSLVNNNLEYWLVGHSANGDIDYSTYYGGSNLSLCVDNNFDGALKIDYFYQDAGSNYLVKRYGYNFSADYVTGYSNLSPLPSQGNCASNYRELVLSVPLVGNKPLLLSAKPMGRGAKIYIYGDADFPVQGIQVSSTGRVGDVNTGVNRKLNVVRLFQVPGFAMDAITTFGNVLSN